ncbi:HAMP domain-containing protein [Pseudoduganella sp. FT26W]|uniref:HAMP domain-containing protein n=1 Tax=Duganella aquatilis TaxID=2666082 RepID=A0A844D5R8_9BURK|nr:methyl-accepting chemotaxis protein [Duganella aquatilis]MRW82850.1 HAMP domain-containing protein [Duganella aquatilis]
MNFANLKIGARLGLAFGLVVVLLLLVVAVAMERMEMAEQRMRNMLDDRYYKIELATTVKYNVAVIHKHMRNAAIVAGPEAVQRETAAMNALRAANKDLLDKFDKVINVPQARELFTSIMAARGRDLENQRLLLKLVAEQQPEQARTLLAGDIAASEKHYAELLNQMTNLQLERMNDEARLTRASFAQARYVMLGIAALTVMLTLLIAWRASRSITVPLTEAVGMARRVAEGDLSARIEVKSANETGQLMRALQEMTDSLTRIVSQVRSGTDTMVTASVQIATGNLDLSARTERQASALEETASSMEELTSTVQQNSHNAQQSIQLAQSAAEVAVKGKRVVGQVVETMGGIDASSRKIVDIISVIDGIAFQTNILALNAAVEAARAGEQGRGFAVVASEVRQLAQRSAAAAREIKELIGNSVQQVANGAQLVAQAGSTMDEVVESVQRVASILGDIGHASTEQTHGIAQINEAIIQMDDVTQQNAALVEEAAAAAQSMREQADSLSQAVGVFRLGERSRITQALTLRSVS